MGDRADSILIVTDGPAGVGDVRLEEMLGAEGIDARSVAAPDALDEVARISAMGSAPEAVVMGSEVPEPLSLARALHRLAPMVQIVFVVDDHRADELARAMQRAPLTSGHWRIAHAGAGDLKRILRDATRATRQRSKLRTTLDRMNLRLRERPAADPDAFRRLVVSDRHLASILEYAEDAIVSVDAEDRVATWNRGAARLFGLEEGEALGCPVADLVRPEQNDELRTLLSTARTGWPLLNVAMACRRADGTPFAAEVTLAPVRDDAGRTVSVSLIARDVTERRRQEQEIRSLNAELEQRVSELRAANRSLKRALEMLDTKQRELVAVNAELELRATTDALTGLKNRIVFQNSLVEMIAVASRQETPLSVLLIDVDHFKRVNDTLGHLEGDRVLKAVASALAAHTREQDVVARFGGEEFSVLLPNTGADAATAVAENLRVGCRRIVPHVEPDLTVSVGAASYRHGDSDVSLLDRADGALYASKAAGRNRVTHADTMDKDRSRR